ncbi:MAG: RNA polymerase sigma factor, partial [Luteolibacter sp.]
FTVCRNRAFDMLRKDKRIQPLDEIPWKKFIAPELPPDQQSARKDQLKQIATCLDRLTANQRDVIILKFQQDLSYREIEAITGLTSGNIGFLIHTGLQRLREILPADLRS